MGRGVLWDRPGIGALPLGVVWCGPMCVHLLSFTMDCMTDAYLPAQYMFNGVLLRPFRLFFFRFQGERSVLRVGKG